MVGTCTECAVLEFMPGHDSHAHVYQQLDLYNASENELNRP